MYLGDFAEDQQVDFKFTTRDADGLPTALTSGAISIYRTSSTTETTAGVTLTADFDSRTGLNHVTVVTTNAFYTDNDEYVAVLTAGTVDGVSVVGEVVASWSIENRPSIVVGTVEADVISISGDSAAADNAEAFFDGTGYAGTNNVIPTVTAVTNGVDLAADALDAAALATDAVTELRNAITGGAYALDTDANGRMRIVDGTGAGELSLTSGLIDGITGTISTLDALDTAQDSQHAQTQSDIAALENLSAAQAEAACDASLVSIHLDHLLAADYDPASKPGTSTALLNELIESDSGVSRFTANALEQGPSGSGASAETIADAVLEELIADHSGTAGSLAAFVLAINNYVDAIPTDVGTALATYDPPTRTELTSDINSVLAILGTPVGDDLADDIADVLAAIGALPSQSDITGGAYALDTDANGRVRVVDGTGAGEIALTSGLIDGITGTIQTLDALDTAQDVEHDATQAAIAALNDYDPTAAITESYAASGAAPTRDQALLGILQTLTQFSISGDTITVGKLDGSAAFTMTMDDATNPTEAKRVAA